MNLKKLDTLIKEELSKLSRKERGHYLHEVELYLLNLCPKHPNHSERYKCEDCQEECKYG